MKADIGIFAHNEEAALPRMLEDVLKLQWTGNPDLDVMFHFLANGCTDGTADIARDHVDCFASSEVPPLSVVEFEQGGKSRTWNRYVHEIARPDAELLLFMDADIRLPDSNVVDKLITRMRADPKLVAFSSRAVKDIVYEPVKLGFVARLIASGAEQTHDYRKSIRGSLYGLEADFARSLTLPIGLPVEDGFVRAMVLTNLLSEPEDLSRIDGDPEVFHLYESLQTVGELLQHQKRIVVGSAVNSALFTLIRREAPTRAAAEAFLREAGMSEDWLPQRLKQELPRLPYGYVPFQFLTKRLKFALTTGRWPGFRGLATLIAGFALDLYAYVSATLQMLRGRAAGYW